ncbi:hypothetical protein BD769DRAFT_1697783 [Suillus cothurnatus]|nr:hypothetical protein BD769DRAFT_1697783 [Suillus cothurnatus]
MQTTFTPLHQDPVHQTTSSGGQPRGYQRSTDAQLSVKAPSTYTSASAIAAQGARHISQLPNVAQSVSIDVASKGRSYAAVPTTTVTAPHPQNLPTAETHKISSISTSYQRIRVFLLMLHPKVADAVASHPHNAEAHAKPYSSRPVVTPVTIPQGINVRAAASTPSAKTQRAPTSNSNPRIPTHPIPPNRTVSLPTPQPVSTSNANPRPPSPRKFSQPLANSSATSTQPFPGSSQGNVSSRPSKTAEPVWAARVAVSVHPSTPAPSRAHLPPTTMNRTFSHESEMLMTPSSIAPSMPKTPQTPQTNFASPHQVTAPPMRQRQVSTESKESKKKGGFLGGLFRTMSGSGSSKPLESPVARSPKLSMEQHKSPAIVAPPMQHSKSTSLPKELKDKAVVSAPLALRLFRPHQHRFNQRHQKTARKHSEITTSSAHPHRDRKQHLSNVFSPFSFLTSKRNRAMSGASPDVCDGNTATNTPLPPMIPPPSRDPMVATSQWRDREEAEQKRRKKSRPRPGVTFDVEENPPDPGAMGKQKGTWLVRRKTGRSTTPGSR